MVEAVQTKELSDAADATKKSWRRDTNNLALSGQIQFSSIMRVFVATPEKMMELASAQSKPKQQADQNDDPVPTGDSGADPRDQKQAGKPAIGGASHARDRQSLTSRPLDKMKPSEVAKPDDKPDDKTPLSADQTTAPADKPQVKTADSVRDDALDAAQAIIPTPATQAPDPTATPSHLVILTQATSELSHGAKTSISAALIDKHFTRVGEDIHDAADTTLTNTVNAAVGPRSDDHSLKDAQASDMASRLSGMGQFKIAVDAGTTTATAPQAQQTPQQSLGADVNFGQFQGLDSGDSSQSGTAFTGTGDGTGGDQKAPSTHANLPVGGAATASSPQDIANVLGQAARVGAAISGQVNTQQNVETEMAAPAAQPIQAIGGVAASGPAQTSQTAKAAPATPPRQPEKPQSPAEQIAVKIRQAVGEGADNINIKLNPHELGRVEVRLEMSKDGGIVATVLADRQETLDMLQKDSRGLERALNDAGLRTDAASLNYGLRGDGQRDQAGNRDRRSGSNSRNPDRADIGRIEFGETTGPAKSPAYRRSLGTKDGVDIRV